MEKVISIVIKEPGKQWERRELDNTLEAFQHVVDGYIEPYTIADDIAIICNEEGRLRQLDYNLYYLGSDWYGTIMMVGVDGEDFCSLDPKMDKYLPKMK